MADDNPNLIPLPSIGESKASKSASMVQGAKPVRSKLWMVVAACVVVGIGLGVYVYQQSIEPIPVATPRPVVTPKPEIPSPLPSPVVPEINAVTPQSNSIVFPKSGEIRVYFGTFAENPAVAGWQIKLITATGESGIIIPGSVPVGDKMVTSDSGLEVAAGQTVKIESYDRGDLTMPSYGWISPDSSQNCGTVSKDDASAMISWATQKSAGEPIVSVQCWADYARPNDTSTTDYNDFLVILTYVPPSQVAATASILPSSSPAASPVASKSPSPSPSQSASPVPSKSPSAAPSSSPKASASTVAAASPSVAPTQSARVTMPEGSSLPDAGIFEVTVGTVGVGLVFILLGVLGLLLI